MNFSNLTPSEIANLRREGIPLFAPTEGGFQRLRVTKYTLMLNTNHRAPRDDFDLGALADAAAAASKRDNLVSALQTAFNLSDTRDLFPDFNGTVAYARINSISGEIGGSTRTIHSHSEIEVGYYVAPREVLRGGRNRIIHLDFKGLRDRTLEILQTTNPDVRSLAFRFRVAAFDELKDLFYQQKDALKTIFRSPPHREEFLNSIPEILKD
jgi:hypothetical protein